MSQPTQLTEAEITQELMEAIIQYIEAREIPQSALALLNSGCSVSQFQLLNQLRLKHQAYLDKEDTEPTR
jgi:hypothetical protein